MIRSVVIRRAGRREGGELRRGPDSARGSDKSGPSSSHAPCLHKYWELVVFKCFYVKGDTGTFSNITFYRIEYGLRMEQKKTKLHRGSTDTKNYLPGCWGPSD